jgi:tetratricopeptide (TPR) repeat protein
MAKVSLRAYNREIEAMVDRGQLDEAIAHSQHILKTFPKHLDTYRLLGKAFLEYKRFNEAVDIFSRVLAAQPNDFVSNVGMSIIRDEQGKMDDAIWHMERAFETQPSNPAIQGELQRLYGRRDGVRPPRIRMTRGALAHMYVQGELYPQAISEIKSVLKEDPGRSDMSVLLARAYYRSGQKNQAADEAAAVLRRYPYCLEANRVLVEIAGAESAQAYRQRVIELDPYAAQVSGTIFQTDEVGDNAVVVEHLEWDGEPAASMPSDWGEAKTAFSEGEFGRGPGEPPTEQVEPDWLKMGFDDSGAAPQPQPNVVPPVSESTSAFDFSAPSELAQPTPEEEIPDFLRAAGWGKSSGAFDESKSAVADEPVPSSTPAESIEQGDLPDWVKAMAPQETAEPTPPAAEEELPDWIKGIGTGALSSAALKSSEDQMDWLQESDETAPPGAVSVPTSSEEPDWLKGVAETSQPESSEEQFDWLKDLGQPSGAPEAAGSDETRMWLQGLEQREAAQPTPAEEQPEWMKGLDQGAETVQPAAADDSLDWLKGIEQPEETAQTPGEDETRIWLKGLEQPESTRLTPAEEGPDWMKGLDQEAETVQPAASDDSLDWLKGIEQPEETATTPGTDETMSWLKGLDEPEPSQPTPIEGQPEWLKGLEQPAEPAQASGSDETPTWIQDLDRAESTGSAAVEEGPAWLKPSAEPTMEAAAPADEFDGLEGVGTEPEAASGSPSMEQPDWLTQFGSETVEQPESELPAAERESIPTFASDEPPTQPHIPAVDVSSLGKSEQEQDDSFAWLEGLAAKQGASEGLLTKPEERLEEEPEWVKQAKGITQPSAPISSEQPPAKAEELGKSQQEIDDSLAWLEGLAAKQGATEGLLTKPEERLEEEPEWVKQARSASQPSTPVEAAPAKMEELGKSQQEIDDSLAWLEGLAAKHGATEGLLTKPEERREDEPDWVKQARAATPPPTPPVATQPPPEEPAPVADLEDLGKSEQERDDSFAWLEALAAKQGASEGLLTKPEERLEEEPEWIKQARSTAPIPSAPSADVKDLHKSEQEREDSLAWLDDVAAEQGPPEERVEQQPDWMQEMEPASQPPAEPEPVVQQPVSTADETPAWLRDLEREELEAEPESAKDETAMWLNALDASSEPESARQPEAADDLPSWLSDLEEQKPEADVTSRAETTTMWLSNLEETESAPEPTLATRAETEVPSWLEGIEEEEKAIPAATGEFDWLNQIEEQPVASAPSEAKAEEDLPAWLRGVDEETHRPTTGALRNLPGWMQDETGEVMAEPTKIEPTRATDWRPAPAEEQPSAPPVPEPVVAEPPRPESQPEPVAQQPLVEEPPKPKPAPRKTRPLEAPPEAMPARSAGTVTPAADPVLLSARSELTRSNIPGALQSYEKLIKKGRFLEEVIYDLRDALYRYPVEVSIWQSLGDAYMRANRLQDALDAYTKAEELLR